MTIHSFPRATPPGRGGNAIASEASFGEQRFTGQSGAGTRTSTLVLSGLLGKDAATAFLLEHWPERSFSIHRPAALLPEVLRRDEIASLDALAQRYRGPVAFGRGATDTRTFNSDGQPVHLFKLGFTVYLYDIAALVPGLPAWLAALEHALGVPACSSKIGAFASPQGDGLPYHFDADDVISVQLRGTKTFEISPVSDLPYPVGQQFGPGMLPHDDLYPQAVDGFPRPDETRAERIQMEPGSVLYLPRGTWHKTLAKSDSLSISVGIRPPNALDCLLPQLRALLLQDPRWRRPLYGIASQDRHASELRRVDALLQELPSTLAKLNSHHLTSSTWAPHVRPDLTRDERFQRVPMATLVAQDCGTGRLSVTVTAWDPDWIERVTLQTEVPSHLRPAIEWLRKRESAFATSELSRALSGVPAIDVWQLLDLLARSGFLHRLHFPGL